MATNIKYLEGTPSYDKLFKLDIVSCTNVVDDGLLCGMLDVIINQKDEIELLKKEIKSLKSHVGISDV
ncbi:TPA: hypothetical protein ACOAY7_002888 [Vibrio cholerae]|nr:hypothetical protein 2017DRC106_1010 [Vibrio phage ICP1]HAS2540019.1 hypothetical protein [Vibrio cholerae]QVV97830.1 hypothetical protein 2017DRC32_1010 [Vibrio phage ICP1]QVV98057.1 hypothetical protein 2017DRC48_1010 [Vibrio phage ICP1]QVV98284.1 hypothetical protein 2017DRC55_1010 [Vibrio phage ICP1]